MLQRVWGTCFVTKSLTKARVCVHIHTSTLKPDCASCKMSFGKSMKCAFVTDRGGRGGGGVWSLDDCAIYGANCKYSSADPR